VVEILLGHRCYVLAEGTLEALAAVDEDHERRHVGLAALAANGTELAQVAERRLLLLGTDLGEWAHAENHGQFGLLDEVGVGRDRVDRGADEFGVAVAHVLADEVGAGERGHLAGLVCLEDFAGVFGAVDVHYLDRVRDLVHVHLLLLWLRLRP